MDTTTIEKADFQSLVTAMQRKIDAMPPLVRPWTTEYQGLPRAMLLMGLRGCGKSTFLLHHCKNKKMLYFSADNPYIQQGQLYEIVSGIFMRGYEGVTIDEVHFAKDWSIQLKALYDDFPDKLIWASDSSSLVLREGNGDLSRRFVPIKMPLLSFREFIFLETGTLYEKYEFNSPKLPVKPDSNILSLFQKYREHGTRPFYQEGFYEDRSLALLDKTLYSDIPFFLPSITDNNMRLMKAIVGTLAYSSIPRLQVRSLCADWGIGAEKLYQLLNVMESVGVVRIIRFENDKKALTAGAKMFFADPCLYGVLNGHEGTEREAFVAMCFAQLENTIEASRTETNGDFIITKPLHKGGGSMLVEVGGKGKKEKHSDFVFRDNTDYPAENAIPFWLLPMMW